MAKPILIVTLNSNTSVEQAEAIKSKTVSEVGGEYHVLVARTPDETGIRFQVIGIPGA